MVLERGQQPQKLLDNFVHLELMQAVVPYLTEEGAVGLNKSAKEQILLPKIR